MWKFLKIGVDLQPLQTENAKGRGIGRFTENLVKSILKNNNNHEYVLFLNALYDTNVNLIQNEKSNLISISYKKCSFDKNSEEVKAIMCRSGNPLYAFVSDVLLERVSARITKEQMFQIYKIYAKENKLKEQLLK